MNVTLERLESKDLELLRKLRNGNRHSFFDVRHVSPEDQRVWWHRYQHEWPSTVEFYSIHLNNTLTVGFLSVRHLKTITMAHPPYVLQIKEIGNILLQLRYRGRGIMHEAITEARRLHDPLTFWVSFVKDDNQPSLRLFERQGFVNAKEFS